MSPNLYKYVGQDDFAAGMLRSVGRDIDPATGVYTALNGLFDDDGDIYRRGGDSFASPAADGPLTFIWTGYLSSQPKGLVTTATKAYSFPADNTLTEIAGGIGLAGPVLPAVVDDKLYLPNGMIWDGTTATTAVWPGAGTPHLAAVGDRLIVARGSRIYFSEAGLPASFLADDYHELPDGVIVVGVMGIRDTCLVFSNYGLWSITNMALDLTDDFGNPQQQMERLTPELSLWHESGLAEWAGQIVAPCVDRIFMVDGLSAPVPISDSIAPVYMNFVRAGLRPGGAKVFRNHLFLPIIGGTLLVCRLNRPVKGRFTYYPWSTFSGHAGHITATDVALRLDAPRFLCTHPDGRVTSLTDVFNPSTNNPKDADDSAFPFEVETRDYQTGSGQPNHTRRFRLYYTLMGEGRLQAAYSVGAISQTYQQVVDTGQSYQNVLDAYANYTALVRGPGVPVGQIDPARPDVSWTELPETAMASPGLDPVLWNFPYAERVRYIRARVRCPDAPHKLTIHRLEFGVRPATHLR